MKVQIIDYHLWQLALFFKRNSRAVIEAAFLFCFDSGIGIS
jgi:hypothetical protein